MRARPCLHCRRIGWLIGHGRLVGYAEASSERVTRGMRLFCSNRHRRRGCGRTCSVWLASVLPRRVVRASTLSALLIALANGERVATAWRRLSCTSQRTGYRLRDRLALRGPAMRTALLSRAPPPPTSSPCLHAHLLAHLRAALGDGADLGSYQLAFETAVLG
jgi:hypothetical protein